MLLIAKAANNAVYDLSADRQSEPPIARNHRVRLLIRNSPSREANLFHIRIELNVNNVGLGVFVEAMFAVSATYSRLLRSSFLAGPSTDRAVCRSTFRDASYPLPDWQEIVAEKKMKTRQKGKQWRSEGVTGLLLLYRAGGGPIRMWSCTGILKNIAKIQMKSLPGKIGKILSSAATINGRLDRYTRHHSTPADIAPEPKFLTVLDLTAIDNLFDNYI